MTHQPTHSPTAEIVTQREFQTQRKFLREFCPKYNFLFLFNNHLKISTNKMAKPIQVHEVSSTTDGFPVSLLYLREKREYLIGQNINSKIQSDPRAQMEAKTLIEVHNSLPIPQRLGDRTLNLLIRDWAGAEETLPLREWLVWLEEWLELCSRAPLGGDGLRRRLSDSEQQSFTNLTRAGQAILRFLATI